MVKLTLIIFTLILCFLAMMFNFPLITLGFVVLAGLFGLSYMIAFEWERGCRRSSMYPPLPPPPPPPFPPPFRERPLW